MKNRGVLKQEFLKTFFDDGEYYEQKLVNGFWLMRWNNAGRWVYTIKTKKQMQEDESKVSLYE